MTASIAVSAAYCALPLAASGAIAVATSSATVPSGPTATRGAEPTKAYARTGSSSAYRPALTGTPASCGYALDAGSASAATVTQLDGVVEGRTSRQRAVRARCPRATEEGVPAVQTSVLHVAAPPLDEGQSVAGHPAREGVADTGETVLGEEEAVPAGAGVLGESVTDGDLVDRMSDCPATELETLAEWDSVRVRIAVHRQEKRMSAAEARVLMVTRASVDAEVGVVARQAAEDVAGVGDPSVLEEERLMAAAAPWAIRGDLAVVDLVAENATQPRSPPRGRSAARDALPVGRWCGLSVRPGRGGHRRGAGP